MSVVSMKALLEGGVHFGHRTRRWNPKMRPYIFTERSKIHIIDLQQTVQRINEYHDLVRRTVANGGTVLFVGTKRQAQATIQAEADRSSMPYVNQRWLGGTLTTFIAAREDELKALLNIPPHMAVAALLPIGKPVKQLTRLKRNPVDEFAALEREGSCRCAHGLLVSAVRSRARGT